MTRIHSFWESWLQRAYRFYYVIFPGDPAFKAPMRTKVNVGFNFHGLQLKVIVPLIIVEGHRSSNFVHEIPTRIA